MAGRTLNSANKKASPQAQPQPQAGLVKAKSDLGDIINRRKTNSAFTPSAFPKASKRSTIEEDQGFVFQRKKPASVPAVQAVAPPKPKAATPPNHPANSTPNNTADAKTKMAAIRRRKSSIGGLKGASSSRRQSSFGIGLSQSTNN